MCRPKRLIFTNSYNIVQAQDMISVTGVAAQLLFFLPPPHRSFSKFTTLQNSMVRGGEELSMLLIYCLSPSQAFPLFITSKLPVSRSNSTCSSGALWSPQVFWFVFSFGVGGCAGGDNILKSVNFTFFKKNLDL